MNPRPALLHRSHTAPLALVLVLYLLFSHPGRMMAQQTGSALKASASGILDNALFITDYNPNGGGSSPCLGPGRLFRIPSMSGWEAGPTVSGLTFDLPTHFSFDSSGRIYVADRENRRVVRMDNVTGSGWKAFSGVGSNLLSMPGARSSCVESLDGVYATAIDSSGRIYISTANPSRIVRIDDMDGAGWTSLNSLSGGTLYLTRSIALDAQGRLYLSDNQLHRIIRVNDIQGNGLVTYGSYGNGPGQFYEPESIAIDSLGRIYISDENNHRVVRINDMTGAGWTAYGSYGSAAGQLSHPHGLALDNSGRLYIQDTSNSRVVRINSIEGGGWTAFGNREIQGRDLRLNASKGIGVLGRGPDLSYISTLPQLTAGGPYRTTIIGMNAGSAEVSADFSFLQNIAPPCASVGSPLLTCAAPLSLTVDGERSGSFSRTVAPLGMVRLDTTSEGRPANGDARIRASDELNSFMMLRTMNGDLIRSEAVVGLSPLADHFTVYIDNTNNAQSGYAIVNPIVEGIEPEVAPGVRGGWINLTAKLRDKAGAILDSQVLNIAPGQQVSEFASERFPEKAAAGFEGSIEFASVGFAFGRTSAVAFRYDNAEADVFTTLPVMFHVENPSREPSSHPYIQPIRTTKLYYPHVVDGSTYRTSFILVNTTDTATTATLEFYSDTGAPLPLPIGGVQRTTYPVSLGARSTARVVTDGEGSAMASGWARLTAPIEGIGGSAIFQTVVDGKIASEAGISASPGATRFITYVNTLGFADSGVALSNPNSSKVDVTLNLRNASGQTVSSTTQALPALGHLAMVISQLAPSGFDKFEGTLEVVAAGGPVTGIALRFDNPGSTIFSATPIVVIP